MIREPRAAAGISFLARIVKRLSRCFRSQPCLASSQHEPASAISCSTNVGNLKANVEIRMMYREVSSTQTERATARLSMASRTTVQC